MYKIYVFIGVYSFGINNFFKHDNFIELFITDILKILLGISGIYILMFIIWKISEIKRLKFLINKTKEYGKYTLELYLLNTIILEYILGQIIYNRIVIQYNYNIIQDNGIIFELISTFIIALIIMEILLFSISKIYRYPKISKLLFYKVKK